MSVKLRSVRAMPVAPISDPSLQPPVTDARSRLRHRQTRGSQVWRLATVTIATLVCLPILAVLWLALFPAENIWPHLLSTVLPGYVLTTLILMVGVAIGTLVIGVSTAWLVTHYEFPLRGWLTWALLLPFAVPAYVIAYVYTDLLEFAGPVQSLLRDWFGWRSARDYWFPAIRSTGGAVTMLVLVLYPYVYLLARAAFLEQSASMLEVARVLGCGQRDRLLRIALPMARPAIVVGVAMALMETLNDYGTVDYFAVRTLTAGIYDVWLGTNNLGGGAQIASLLLVFVMMLIGLEKVSRARQHNYQPGSSRLRPLTRRRPAVHWQWTLCLLCLLPVLLGFVVPAWVLLRYSISHFDASLNSEFYTLVGNSVLLAALAAGSATSIGVILSYSKRMLNDRALSLWVSLSSLGYAVPGAVLAIGIMIPFSTFDNALDSMMRSTFGVSTGLLLSGTVFALVFAYTIRFLAVAFGSIDASMKKISPNMDDAARALGQTPFGILRKVHLPLMRSGLLTAALVVFVDCMKELPATLILRPFNFDTLATHVYQYASDELLAESSLAALLIVVAGLIPVLLLSLGIERSRGSNPSAHGDSRFPNQE